MPPTRDEVERLGKTLNAMLGRLEAALRARARFVADAGHELRRRWHCSNGARARPAALPHSRRSSARPCGARRRRPTGWPSSPRTCCCSPAPTEGSAAAARAIEAADDPHPVRDPLRWRGRAAGQARSTSPGDGPSLDGDPLRLEQALGNLVDNALRYGEGAVRALRRPATAGRAARGRRGRGLPAGVPRAGVRALRRADDARERRAAPGSGSRSSARSPRRTAAARTPAGATPGPMCG